MLNNITIGQYYPENSVIHKLDPRFKILGTFIYIASVFLAKDFISYGICFAFFLSIIFISKIPLLHVIKGLKFIFILLLITFIINLFSYNGDPLWKFYFLTITKQGLIRAIYMLFRVCFLIIGASILSFTTTPIKLTDGFESLMCPLKKIKVPAHEIAMMMSIAIRYIPVLATELDKIMKAEGARGIDFNEGNIIKKFKNLIPIFVPLLIRAFSMAEILALAMESRCYNGGENRTKYHPL
ncbi:MAG: energy-coupling factor transporter transmembrane protein EcfT, partial [Clostridiales Family XIII bacterium]|nr:energy-coupling factor transporter transmembrane protein EcfT [Clostridiales Family XIII bacterium]